MKKGGWPREPNMGLLVLLALLVLRASQGLMERLLNESFFSYICEWCCERVCPLQVKNLLTPLFLLGCCPRDFEEAKRPTKAFKETAHQGRKTAH